MNAATALSVADDMNTRRTSAHSSFPFRTDMTPDDYTSGLNTHAMLISFKQLSGPAFTLNVPPTASVAEVKALLAVRVRELSVSFHGCIAPLLRAGLFVCPVKQHQDGV